VTCPDPASSPASPSHASPIISASPETSAASRIRVAAVYIGGLLGPFGGGVVSPMLVGIGTSLHSSTSTAAASLTAYFVPFAVVQLVSGTLGERWGRRRTVQAAYLVYALAAVACALAPTMPVFLALRGVLGVANAFTSPLLLAGLSDLVAPGGLSRSVGVFASCQAAGQSFAPLIGGVAAEVSWRWAFVVVAGVGAILALAPPPGEPRPGSAAPSYRPLLSTRMALLAFVGLLSYVGGSALPFLVSLFGEQRLGLSPGRSGLTLLGFGVAGLLLGTLWGTVCERYGPRLAGAAGAVATAVWVAAVGFSGSGWTLAACWTAAGASVSLLTVAIQNMAVRAVPGNRGGALSAISAFRFSGAALGPVIWLPVYAVAPWLAFTASGASMLLAVPALALMRDRARPGATPATAE